MRLDGITRYTHTSSVHDSRSRYLFSARTGGDSVHELDNIPLAITKTTVTGGYPSAFEERENEEDDGSQSSQAGIIRATRTFDITEEHVR